MAETSQAAEAKTMSIATKRLMALDDADRAEANSDGRKAGREWAETSATPKELQRIKRLLDAPENSVEAFFEERDGDAFCVAEHLAAKILGDDGPSRRSCEAFWDEAVGDTEEASELWHSEGFARGFAAGALEVWEEARVQDRTRPPLSSRQDDGVTSSHAMEKQRAPRPVLELAKVVAERLRIIVAEAGPGMIAITDPSQPDSDFELIDEAVGSAELCFLCVTVPADSLELIPVSGFGGLECACDKFANGLDGLVSKLAAVSRKAMLLAEEAREERCRAARLRQDPLA